MPEYREDAGYHGHIISLGGVIGRENAGLVTTGDYQDLSVARTLIGLNAKRKWAFFQNVSTAGEIIRLQIGVLGAFYINLNPGASFQIDDNLPWTGAVGADSPTPGATALVRVVEASVDG